MDAQALILKICLNAPLPGPPHLHRVTLYQFAGMEPAEELWEAHTNNFLIIA